MVTMFITQNNFHLFSVYLCKNMDFHKNFRDQLVARYPLRTTSIDLQRLFSSITAICYISRLLSGSFSRVLSLPAVKQTRFFGKRAEIGRHAFCSCLNVANTVQWRRKGRGIVSHLLVTLSHQLISGELYICSCHKRDTVYLFHRYSYLSRRCVTKDECVGLNRLRRIYSVLDDDQAWRPFNGSCVTHCPDGYEDALDENNVRTMFPLSVFRPPLSILDTINPPQRSSLTFRSPPLDPPSIPSGRY